jgi:hypothetical protein
VVGIHIDPKGLVVGIVLLFIGVTVAPSINQSVVKASNDNDLVEVTTQACGIKGYGDTTVKLTREQYQNLEQYLVEFRARLNQTTTREEAVPIFKEAVVELNKYGLLPRGMGVKQVQNIVTCSTCGPLSSVVMKRLQSSSRFGNNSCSNVNCLIAGETDITFFQSTGSVLLEDILFFLHDIGFPHNFFYLQLVCFYLALFSNRRFLSFSLSFLNRFYIGCNVAWDPYDYQMASGWINTIGSYGVKNIQGEMIGVLPVLHYFGAVGPDLIYELHPAILGFTGIKIRLASEYLFLNTFSYIGSAFWVEIDSEHP